MFLHQFGWRDIDSSQSISSQIDSKPIFTCTCVPTVHGDLNSVMTLSEAIDFAGPAPEILASLHQQS